MRIHPQKGKKMIRKLRKGFTIVELVIVIAVIAVLTAVLIPTFIHLSKKANKASDNSLVANLNTALAMEVADSGKSPTTMHDAVLGLDNQGYRVPQLVTKSDEELLYCIKENKFFLTNDAEELIQQRNSDEDPRNDLHHVDFWRIYDNVPGTQKWSIYAYAWKGLSTVSSLTVGFDAGLEDIEVIGYNRATATTGQSVVIRANGGTLNVNAPHDTVDWYGASKVNIDAIDDHSFHAFGKPVGEVQIASGHYVVESDYETNFLVTGDNVSITTNSADEVIVLKDSEVTSYTVNGVSYTSSSVVSGETSTATIDDTKAVLNASTKVPYDTLNEAISAAAFGEKLVVLKDLTIVDSSPVPSGNNNNFAIKIIEKSISINGNGKLITSDGQHSANYSTHDLFNLEQSGALSKEIVMNFYNMNIVATHYQDVFLLNSDVSYDFKLVLSDSTITCDGETVYSNGPTAIAVLNDCTLKHEGEYAPGKDNRYYSALIVGYGGFVNAYNCKIESFGNGVATFPSGGVINLFNTDIKIEAVAESENSGFAICCTMEPNSYEGLYVIRGAEISVHGGTVNGRFYLKDTSTAYDAQINLFEGKFDNDPSAYVVNGKTCRQSGNYWIVA